METVHQYMCEHVPQNLKILLDGPRSCHTAAMQIETDCGDVFELFVFEPKHWRKAVKYVIHDIGTDIDSLFLH